MSSMSQKIFGTITYTNIIIEIGYANISINYAEQKSYKIDLRPTCKLIINLKLHFKKFNTQIFKNY